MTAMPPATVNPLRGPRSALPVLDCDGRWATGFLATGAFSDIKDEGCARDSAFQDKKALLAFCSLMGEVSEWKLPRKCGSFPATHGAWLDIRGPKNEEQIFRLINHLLHVCRSSYGSLRSAVS